jgi:hypothetical protein
MTAVSLKTFMLNLKFLKTNKSVQSEWTEWEQSAKDLTWAHNE